MKKTPRPQQSEPIKRHRVKRVSLESAEVFHLVSFVWLKIPCENKQRKRISIIPQRLQSLEACSKESESLAIKACILKSPPFFSDFSALISLGKLHESTLHSL